MALLKTDIQGLKEMALAFAKMPEIAREAFNEAVEKAAQYQVEQARAALTPGHGFRTGQLKRALGYVINRKSGSAATGIRLGFESFRPGRSATAANLYRPTRAGHLVEFGHGGPSPATAKPFMMPAAERTRAYFLTQCQAAGKVMEREMATIGGRFL
jgi:hypothetical protein